LFKEEGTEWIALAREMKNDVEKGTWGGSPKMNPRQRQVLPATSDCHQAIV